MIETRLERYYDSEDARSELFSFYRLAYPNMPWMIDSRRFEWQTFENPIVPAGESDIWLLRDESSGLIVGHNSLLRYPLKIGVKEVTGFCSTNLIVLPHLIGKGVGHELIRNNENQIGVAYAVGITPASTRAFQKRGWSLVSSAKLCSKIENARKNLRFLGFSGAKLTIGQAAIASLNAFSTVLSMMRSMRVRRDFRISEVDKFESGWNSIWRDILSVYAINFKREAVFLNYKYTNREGFDHRIIVVEDGSNLIGYCVYRISIHPVKQIRLCRVVDMVCNPAYRGHLPAALLEYIIGRVASENVDGIVMVAPNSEFVSEFRRAGALLSRVQPAIIREDDFDLRELESAFHGLWYITLGDSDLDNYW